MVDPHLLLIKLLKGGGVSEHKIRYKGCGDVRDGKDAKLF